MIKRKKIDWTKPVQTRTGIPVEITSTTARGLYPVLGYIGECQELSKWTADGDCYASPHIVESDWDIMNAPVVPKELTVWVPLFKDCNDNLYEGDSYTSREELEKDCQDDISLVGIRKVHFVENEFDN